MQEERIKEAIDEIKKGNMLILIDDEDRENEGDLIYAGNFSTPQKVNFMATYAKGLICVAITDEIAKKLELKPMVDNNDSAHETAFTISVDAKSASTGISAKERDDTIKIISNPVSKASLLVKPGHIFPLIAKKGGVLVRTGHTEGSVDLCKLAGVFPSAVICEIMKEDGTMARRKDLEIFSKKHNIKTVYISDIVKYRMLNESLLTQKDKVEINFFEKKAKKIIFKDHMDRRHTAIIYEHKEDIVNVRVHKSINDIELFFNYKRYENLIKSIKYIRDNGGIILFIDDKSIDNITMKQYGIGAQILKHLGIKKMKLISHIKNREFVGLAGFGLEIVDTLNL